MWSYANQSQSALVLTPSYIMDSIKSWRPNRTPIPCHIHVHS